MIHRKMSIHIGSLGGLLFNEEEGLGLQGYR